MGDVETNDNGLSCYKINSMEEWVDRFHELNAFVAVVEAGGFSAAARTTGDSQSAISKAIGALEKRLGVMLFNRSTRRVTLTDQGRRYYDRTKPLVDSPPGTTHPRPGIQPQAENVRIFKVRLKSGAEPLRSVNYEPVVNN